MSTWETIGYLPVDAGCMMLIDPCYVLDDQKLMAEAANEDRHVYLNEVCSEWSKFTQVINGLGIVVETGYGDGSYPVQIRYTRDGRVAEVRITFDE